MLLFSVAIFGACSEDDENQPPINGVWEGTQATYQAYVAGIPAPVFDETDNDFDAIVEFEDDGILSVVNEDGTINDNGTWAYADGKKKIVVTGAFSDNEYFDESETFTIKELTESKLTLYLEKEMSVETDEGVIDANAKVTMKFNKVL